MLLHNQFRFYGINSPLERGQGVCLFPVLNTPLPLSRGEYIKFNVVMYYFSGIFFSENPKGFGNP